MGSKYQLATVCIKNELEDQAPHEIDHGIGMGLGMIFIHKNVSRTIGVIHIDMLVLLFSSCTLEQLLLNVKWFFCDGTFLFLFWGEGIVEREPGECILVYIYLK